MEVVPVIDLKGGVVVHAQRGNRAAYRPIETPLSPTSDPLDVVAGLLSLHSFRTLYVADLDAIEAKGSSTPILEQISAAFPGLMLWVDNGCSELSAAERFLGQFGPARASLVLGSESQRDAALLRALRDRSRIILSLDFRGERFLGPNELLERAELWPRRIIVMTLARVGSGDGPDFDRYAAVRKRAGDRAVYLAGGLRDRRDLAAVKESGAAGILVASALHDGRISSADMGLA